MVRKLSLVLAAAALLGLAAACGDDDDDGDPTTSPSTTTSTPTEQPSETASATPSPDDPTRTPPAGRIGDEEIDLTIDAIEAGDVEAIVERFAYLTVACESAPGIGGPPACDQDQPEGTEVDVVPLIGCEGEHIRESNAETIMGRWLEGTTAEVYAVATLVTEGQDELYPEGDYVVVVSLEREDVGPEAFAFGLNEDGGIVSTGPRCQATAADILDQSAVDTVLVPPPDER